MIYRCVRGAKNFSKYCMQFQAIKSISDQDSIMVGRDSLIVTAELDISNYMMRSIDMDSANGSRKRDHNSNVQDSHILRALTQREGNAFEARNIAYPLYECLDH